MTSTHDPSSHNEPTLSQRDQELLDALIENDFDRDAISPRDESDIDRLNAITNLFGLMDDYPVEDVDDTLLHATTARIDRVEDDRAARMNIESRQAVAEDGRGRRWLPAPDFISVAAVILIGFSVGWPLFHSVRARSIDASCANNMRIMGNAFNLYANDNANTLPVAMAGPFGSWDSVKNVLNLAPLVNGGYCEAGHMDCPGHKNDYGPSYSYRWFVPGSPVRWGSGQVTIVIGDLNPVVEAARAGKFVPALSVSLNHNGRGQNVLSSDGATSWLVKPVVGKDDNIWLPDGHETLLPGDQPTEPLDTFLTH